MHGTKQFETRTWAPAGTIIGTTIAIHAGARVPPGAADEAHRDGYRIAHVRGDEHRIGRYPLGAVLGTAIVSNVGQVVEPHAPGETRVRWMHPADPVLPPGVVERESRFGNLGVGMHLWALRHPAPLTAPVPAIGRQTLWNWEPQ